MSWFESSFIEPRRIFGCDGWVRSPPYGIIQLAAYLEREVKGVQLEVLDCNAEKVDWKDMEKRIASSNPDIVVASSLATCNTYAVVRTLETRKRFAPNALTVTGGQHFTATAQESLAAYPEIDFIVRGEGERTFAELVKCSGEKSSLAQINGLSFRQDWKIVHNPPRSLIENLEDLPFPGYHLVKNLVRQYHFSVMRGKRHPMLWLKVHGDAHMNALSVLNGDIGKHDGESNRRSELPMRWTTVANRLEASLSG